VIRRDDCAVAGGWAGVFVLADRDRLVDGFRVRFPDADHGCVVGSLLFDRVS